MDKSSSRVIKLNKIQVQGFKSFMQGLCYVWQAVATSQARYQVQGSRTSKNNQDKSFRKKFPFNIVTTRFYNKIYGLPKPLQVFQDK